MPQAGNVLKHMVIAERPGAYKASDAAYQTGGNDGFYLKSAPEFDSLTSQQKKVREAAKECGIEAGISKSELQEKMKNCIPDQF